MIAAAIQWAWWWSSLPAARAYWRALREPQVAQNHLLRGLLKRHAHCVWGERYQVSRIHNREAYRARVPLSCWADYQSAVEQLQHGQHGLLCSDRVTRLIPTSGSSSACKLIPWTAGLQRSFSAALGPWLHDLCRRFPSIRGGPAYWAVSPPASPCAQSGTLPIGCDDDSTYLGPRLAPLLAKALAVAPRCPGLDDPAHWLTATCLHLLACAQLRLISVWHPSFFMVILDHMVENREQLLQHLQQGAPRYGLHPQVNRAQELAGKAWHAQQWWPQLTVLSCWRDGPAAIAAEALSARLPGVAVERKGLLCTEGVSSIPIAGRCPLALHSSLIELLGDDGKLYWGDELRLGQRGEVVLTTGGGLWRYQTGDLVEVDGFLGATPCLRFLARRGTVHDLAGEKLDEGQVAKALAQAQVRAGFAALQPLPEQRCYALLVDREATVNLAAVEEALLASVHYRLARNLGQLQALRLCRFSCNSATLLAHYTRGARLGAVKPPLLLAASLPGPATCLA